MAKRPNKRWMAAQRNSDSLWEADLRDGIFSDLEYHPEKINYVVPHTYEPDFQCGNVLIECKGRFRESSEARKYLFVRESLKEPLELVFLLYKANVPMPHAKARKDGSKATHEDWLEKHGFKYFHDPVQLRKYLDSVDLAEE